MRAEYRVRNSVGWCDWIPRDPIFADEGGLQALHDGLMRALGPYGALEIEVRGMHAPSRPPAPVKGPSNPAIKDTTEDGSEEGGGDSP